MGKIIRYNIPTHSIAWHNFRRAGLTEEDCIKYNSDPYSGGIGASEISKLFPQSGNKWRPVLPELYHFKIGTETPSLENNAFTVNGLYDEEKIKLYWSLYNGVDNELWDSVIKYIYGTPGERNKLYVRRARRVNAYLVNSDFPFLFASLDYHAEKETLALTGVLKPNGFPLECKTVNGKYARMWESGLPEYHIIQAQQQMLITETDYCEIAALVDGRYFNIYPVERDDRICKLILIKGREFWEQIMEGREKLKMIYKSYESGNAENAERLRAEIDSCEPDIGDTEAAEEYLKERYYKEVDKISGDFDHYDLAIKYKTCAEYIKAIKGEQQYCKNHLIQIMKDYAAEKIDFDEAGYVSLMKDANKKNPTFRNNIRFAPDAEKVRAEIDKLDLNLFN